MYVTSSNFRRVSCVCTTEVRSFTSQTWFSQGDYPYPNTRSRDNRCTCPLPYNPRVQLGAYHMFFTPKQPARKETPSTLGKNLSYQAFPIKNKNLKPKLISPSNERSFYKPCVRLSVHALHTHIYQQLSKAIRCNRGKKLSLEIYKTISKI